MGRFVCCMLTALRWAAVVALVGLPLATAGGASAGTVVTGDQDANAPLVIDPSTNPADPYIRETSSATETVVFIQRMPVTKAINRVTLGNLGLGSGCASGMAAAQIWEHDGAAWGGTTDLRHYATGSVPLPATPGEMTWTFPTTILLENHAYSFRVSVSGCPTFKHTTWAHNFPQVEGGPSWCEQGPSDRRMWHVDGIDDATWSCVTRTEPYRTFKPDMPGGWLVSHQPSTTWDIMAGSYLSSGQPSSYACTTSSSRNPATLGAGWVYWRPRPDLPDYYNDFVCAWSQFGPPGVQLDDGWYYALPWLTERGGAPRDMYLRLDTAGYGSLLEDHAPVLKYDSGETFHAISPGAMTDFADPPSGGYSLSDAFVNILWDDSGNEIAAAGSPGPGNGPWPPVMVLGVLGENYRFGPSAEDQPAASSTDYINPRGESASTYAADAASMEASSAYADKVYGRVAYGGDDGPVARKTASYGSSIGCSTTIIRSRSESMREIGR